MYNKNLTDLIRKVLNENESLEEVSKPFVPKNLKDIANYYGLKQSSHNPDEYYDNEHAISRTTFGNAMINHKTGKYEHGLSYDDIHKKLKAAGYKKYDWSKVPGTYQLRLHDQNDEYDDASHSSGKHLGNFDSTEDAAKAAAEHNSKLNHDSDSGHYLMLHHTPTGKKYEYHKKKWHQLKD